MQLTTQQAKTVHQTICEAICRIEDLGDSAHPDLKEHLVRLNNAASIMEDVYKNFEPDEDIHVTDVGGKLMGDMIKEIMYPVEADEHARLFDRGVFS